MSEEIPQYDLKLSYDELANHIFTSLINLAYVPGEDEVLDIADIVFEFIFDMLIDAGIELHAISELEEGEE